MIWKYYKHEDLNLPTISFSRKNCFGYYVVAFKPSDLVGKKSLILVQSNPLCVGKKMKHIVLFPRRFSSVLLYPCVEWHNELQEATSTSLLLVISNSLVLFLQFCNLNHCPKTHQWTNTRCWDIIWYCLNSSFRLRTHLHF